MILYFSYLLLQIKSPQNLMSLTKLKNDLSLTNSVAWKSGQFLCGCDQGAHKWRQLTDNEMKGPQWPHSHVSHVVVVLSWAHCVSCMCLLIL